MILISGAKRHYDAILFETQQYEELKYIEKCKDWKLFGAIIIIIIAIGKWVQIM